MFLRIIKILILLLFVFEVFGLEKESNSSLITSKLVRYNNPDTSVSTIHKAIINGKHFLYKAIAGTLPLYDERGKIIAGIFYTYYERVDTKNKAIRPIIFCFNGGPGSSSTLLHVGYLGPRIVKLQEDGLAIQPYELITNPNSVLDAADLVFIDPIETGYSRTLRFIEPGDKQFFSLQGDINYLGTWIETFLARYKLWLSPKYLLGESYGSYRVSGLAENLSEKHGIYINGVVLVSGGENVELEKVLNIALKIPEYAKICWSNDLLNYDLQKKSIEALLLDVQEFTYSKLIPALIKIGFIDSLERIVLAKSISEFTTLPVDLIIEKNLLIDKATFTNEIFRENNLLIPSHTFGNDTLRRLRLSEAIDLSGYIATAWYHKLLDKNLRYKSVGELVENIDQIVVTELIPAICMANSLSYQKRQQLIDRFSLVSGLSVSNASKLIQSILDETQFSWSEIFGHLYFRAFDTRFTAIYQGVTETPFEQTFKVGINHYIRNELKFNVNTVYKISNLETRPWGFDGITEIDKKLLMSMSNNPFMHLMFQVGYYDGSELRKKIQMWQFDPAGKLKDRIHFKTYDAGHMMYVRKEDRKKANNDLREFITNSFGAVAELNENKKK